MGSQKVRIGYGRVSSVGQSLEIQKKRLHDYGCEKIYLETMSAKKGLERKELEKVLDYIREGDALVVTKLDRLVRSVVELGKIAEKLDHKKVDLVVLDQNIDTSTPTGRLTFHMIAAIAEFERDMIAERTAEGRLAAKQNGIKFGRPNALDGWSRKKLQELVIDFDSGTISKEELAKQYKMGKSTLYRAVKRARELTV